MISVFVDALFTVIVLTVIIGIGYYIEDDAEEIEMLNKENDE